jgi:general stress protein CsbA
MEHCKKTLQIDNPMVVFCDKKTKPLIETIRRTQSKAPTIYIERNIDDYDYFKLNWPIISENRKDSQYYDNSRNTTSYFLTVMFKVMAFKIAHEKNYFNSEYFVWVDMGCGHIIGDSLIDDVTAIITNPKPKVTALYIHYRSSKELEDMDKMCNTGICGIAATIFTIEASYVNRFFCSMWAIFYEQLSRGIGHTEETILTYCYDRNPDMFNLYYGDYYSTAANYHHIRKDYYSVKNHFIINALRANRKDLVLSALENIKESINGGFLELDSNELLFINSLNSLKS